MAIDYCGANASDSSRCEAIAVNGVNSLIDWGIPVEYTSEVIEQAVHIKGRAGSVSINSAGDERDELFEKTVRMICQHDRASASLIQRRLQVGFNRAARLLEQLEEAGVVSPPDGSKPRDVLVRNADEFLNGPASADIENS